MAITVSKSTVQNFGLGHGPHTFNHDIGASDYLIAVVCQRGSDPLDTAATWNGVSMTLLKSVASGANGTIRIWGLTNPAAGANDFIFDESTQNQTNLVLYYGTVNGLPTFGATDSGSGSGGVPTITIDTGTVPSRIIGGNIHETGTWRDPGAGFVVDNSPFAASQWHIFWKETADASGSRTNAWDNQASDYWLTAAVSVLEGDPVLEPTSHGIETGFTAGGGINLVVGSGSILLPETSRGMEFGFQAGINIVKTAPRQVALVNEGIDLTESTEGGTEGQVLTRHAKSKPTWEDAGAALAVAEADGSPDVADIDRIEVSSKFKVTDDTGGQVTLDEAGHWEPVGLDEAVVFLDNDPVMAWVAD